MFWYELQVGWGKIFLTQILPPNPTDSARTVPAILRNTVLRIGSNRRSAGTAMPKLDTGKRMKGNFHNNRPFASFLGRIPIESPRPSIKTA